MNGETNVLTRAQPFLLEPTGGSTAGTKLIPYTHALKKEFRHAVDPWIAGLFLRWPGLLFGRQYWSITPATEEKQNSAVRIGFDDDSAYLGHAQQFIAQRILAVPPEVAKSADHRTAEFITLVLLLNCPSLRLISFWHPSLLTLMLQTLETRFEELLLTIETGKAPVDIQSRMPLKRNPRRAEQLRSIGCVPSKIWKKLKIISCWGGTSCQSWLNRLQAVFPDTYIQPKGLVATEGITSIPLGTSLDIAAIRSHFYEFECEETKKLLPLWQIESGKNYQLILTTGGGLYRYRTGDLINVSGFIHRTPRIHFITRSNITSDRVGEKLSLAQAEKICRHLPCNHRFAMIAPEEHGDGFRYALYIEADSKCSLESYLEAELCRNYHYRHARNTRQLEAPVIRWVENGENKTIAHLTAQGRQAGGIKQYALSTETYWKSILGGGAA